MAKYRITLLRHVNGEHQICDVAVVRHRNNARDLAYRGFYEMAGFGAARDTRRAWDVRALVEAWPLSGDADLSVILGNHSLTLETLH